MSWQIGGLGEEFGDGGGYFWTNFGDFFELLLGGGGEFFERRKMAGQQFAGAFADETDSQRVNQPGQAGFLLAAISSSRFCADFSANRSSAINLSRFSKYRSATSRTKPCSMS